MPDEYLEGIQAKTSERAKPTGGLTPKPWGYHKCLCGHPACDKFVINHSGAEGMFEEDDACLIAAAPELLEELREMVAFFSEYSDLIVVEGGVHPDSINARFDVACAIIKKAILP